ncbi:MAG: hypothetical protein ABID09_03190 [Candidatus Omnitrophota bacterium]
MEARKRKKRKSLSGEKPLFRSEDDLEEYGKPTSPRAVNFDDEE